jgi:Ni,Fe-hydrogenase III large subunit
VNWTGLELRNRRAVSLEAVPLVSIERLRDEAQDAVGEGWRLASFFGMPDGGSETRLVLVLAHDRSGNLGALSARVGDRYPALTSDLLQAHQFEREIREQCGVEPVGHPDLRPLRRHPPDHLPPNRAPELYDRTAYPFRPLPGEEVHEVAVGPVHAGVIEPGHFRFVAHGEEVLDLDIVLGYQHRGVERLLEKVSTAPGILVAESIAGDSVIAHAGAYSGALEALSRTKKTPRAQAIRGLALELERIANHLGDLGAMAGDIAYQPAANYLGRLRGECLNLQQLLTGNRYGRGLVRPGGVGFDLTAPMAAEMHSRLLVLRDELGEILPLLFDNASVQARFEGVGRVERAQCEQLGLVGPVARACEVARDVRHDHPYGIFRFAHIPVATAFAGDVLARALVRRLEVQRSVEFLLDHVEALPRGESLVPLAQLRPSEITVTMEEGWRGELVHVAITDSRGALRRYKITDPSFHNWRALATAMRGNQISDFPLCNKSFNLSYAGHDL